MAPSPAKATKSPAKATKKATTKTTKNSFELRDLSNLPDDMLGEIGMFLPTMGFSLKLVCRSLSKCPAFGTVVCRYGTREFFSEQFPAPTVFATAEEAIENLNDAVKHFFDNNHNNPEEINLIDLVTRKPGMWDEESYGKLKDLTGDEINETDWITFAQDKIKANMTADLDKVLAAVNSRGAEIPNVLNDVLDEYKNEGSDNDNGSMLHYILAAWWFGREEWCDGQDKHYIEKSFGPSVERFNLRPSIMFVSRDKSMSHSITPCQLCRYYKSDTQIFTCSFKYCHAPEGHFCRSCLELPKCSTCGKEGCGCRFDICAAMGCKNTMCNCYNFKGWKVGDSGERHGCSFVLYPPEPDEDEDEDEDAMCEAHREAEENVYCETHKPKNSVPSEHIF